MTHLNFLQKNLKFFILFIGVLVPFSTVADNNKTIGITQIVDHPSLDAIREGIIEELAKQGFVKDQNLTIIFESAQGNPIMATQIAQKFASLPLDAVVPISTPSAQAVVHQIKKTPIIFAAISDPVGASIVSSLEHPGGNVTGVADTPPLLEQMNFIEACIPQLKILGVVYNPGEANSASMIVTLKTLAAKKNILISTAAASKSADVQSAAHSLVGHVEAIFVGNDNTVVSGLESLVKACLDTKTPLFVSDPHSVDRGALAAYAYDQRQMGNQVGGMVAKILKGINPGSMPVERATDLKFSLNPQTAEKIKVTCTTAR
ncbi:MAG: ABC transporter substrate-binding protein [Alphaproteobacteria bacterium]|nr:ABC transporter substrate-binding protein [Alphaproteobacteria bacterium]